MDRYDLAVRNEGEVQRWEERSTVTRYMGYYDGVKFVTNPWGGGLRDGKPRGLGLVGPAVVEMEMGDVPLEA